MDRRLPGLGYIDGYIGNDLVELETAGEGRWRVGFDGVKHIFTPLDRKAEFIVYEDYTLTYVESAMGYPAIYPLEDAIFESPATVIQHRHPGLHGAGCGLGQRE